MIVDQITTTLPITTLLKSKSITIESALDVLSIYGYCPALLNDDNGHWAVTFEGFQAVPTGNNPEDIETTFFVEAADWKDSIREALIHALEKE
jgi:hypothetical protein